MRSHLSGFILAAGLLGITSGGWAQQTTERFIPMGQSPGVSGTLSYIGEIESVDSQARTITVAGDEGSLTIAVVETTEIWLDRSGTQQTNSDGSFTDLQVGRRVEVKYMDASVKEQADWIKVAMAGGG